MSRFAQLTRLSLFAAAATLATGCDMNFVPDLADSAGGESVLLTVTLGSNAATDLASDVEAVEVRVVDVLVHRADSDEWLILNEKVATVALGHEASEHEFTDVPLPVGTYDRVFVAMEQARVGSADGWQRAELVQTEVEIPASLLIGFDGKLEINFDLDGSVSGSYEAGWKMNPQLVLEME